MLCSSCWLRSSSQTGVLLAESVTAVVAAIHWMSSQDLAAAASNKVDETDTKKQDAVDIEEKLNEERQSLLVTENYQYQHLERDLNEVGVDRRAMQWVWDGSDFVWCSTEVVQEVDLTVADDSDTGSDSDELDTVRRRRSCAVDYSKLLSGEDDKTSLCSEGGGGSNSHSNNESSKRYRGSNDVVGGGGEKESHRSYRRKLMSSSQTRSGVLAASSDFQKD